VRGWVGRCRAAVLNLASGVLAGKQSAQTDRNGKLTLAGVVFVIVGVF
jgi:hypothetical protein